MNLKISREIKVGFIFIAALALLIWGYNYLKGRNILVREHRFYAVYNDVNGLAIGSPVFIKGIKVGLVKEMGFLPSGNTDVVVELSLKTKIRVPDNSVSRIFSYDLMGSKAVDVVLGDSRTFARSGDTLASDVQPGLKEEVSRIALPFKKKAEELMLSLDSVITVFQAIFNESTRENLINSFESIKVTIRNLERTTYNIDTLMSAERSRIAGIITNLESITYNIKGNNQKISNIIGNFSTLSDTLARIRVYETIQNVNETLTDLDAVIEKINKGQGSVALLLNDDKLYRRLESSASDLDQLLQDVKLNPQRYVHFSLFGKNPNKHLQPLPQK